MIIRGRNSSSNKNLNFLNSKFPNSQTDEETYKDELDLNEILNQEVQEERDLIQVTITNISKITHTSKINFEFGLLMLFNSNRRFERLF